MKKYLLTALLLGGAVFANQASADCGRHCGILFNGTQLNGIPSYGPVFQGTQVNGIPTYGPVFQGTQVNGIPTYGPVFQGTQVNGIPTYGPVFQGTQVNGIPTYGPVFQGTQVNGIPTYGPVFQGVQYDGLRPNRSTADLAASRADSRAPSMIGEAQPSWSALPVSRISVHLGPAI